MRKSLNRSAAMGSKAQEMLGLSSNGKSRNVISKQLEGWLMKKPFAQNKSKILRSSSWQRRYFVIKDSFLFWYTVKPSVTFDMQVQGALPLGGCSVFPFGKDKDGGFIFEITHPDFNGNVLQLKCKAKNETDSWIAVLTDCSKATWQNAMLGDALIQKLKHAGTTLEKEKEAALQEARRNAEEFAELRTEKLRIMEEQFDTQRQYEAELLREKERAAELEGDLDSKAQALEREKREQQAEKTRMEIMERKLEEAYKAIQQLEGALERRQRTDLEGMTPNPELQAHIETIKQFMAERHGGGVVSLPSSSSGEDDSSD